LGRAVDAKLCLKTVLHRHEEVLANHPEHGVPGVMARMFGVV